MGMTVLHDSHVLVLAVLITLLSHVWLKRGSAIYYTLHSYKEATTSISWRRGTIDHTPWYETQHPAKEFYISRAQRYRHLILYARFNSTCYHPPRAYPWALAFFFKWQIPGVGINKSVKCPGLGPKKKANAPPPGSYRKQHCSRFNKS